MATESTHRTDRRIRLGRHGELLAAAHLRALGFEILAHNERTRYGEIDLIAFDGDTLVFAEVKTRRARSRLDRPGAAQRGSTCESELGWPAFRQRRRLRRLALAWLSDRRRPRPRARTIRFDVLRVLVGERGRLLALDHLPGAL